MSDHKLPEVVLDSCYAGADVSGQGLHLKVIEQPYEEGHYRSEFKLRVSFGYEMTTEFSLPSEVAAWLGQTLLDRVAKIKAEEAKVSWNPYNVGIDTHKDGVLTSPPRRMAYYASDGSMAGCALVQDKPEK